MTRKLLVVDDEEDYRFLLEGFLRKRGYEVLTAANGEEGLERCLAEAPDLVLLDVQMPGMDGFTVCRKLREREAFAKVPVIFCTVRSAVAPVAEGLAAGGADYVVKPFELDDLLRRVRVALGEEPP